MWCSSATWVKLNMSIFQWSSLVMSLWFFSHQFNVMGSCCHRSQLFKLCPESHIFLCCHLHCYLARQAKTKSIEIDYIQASYSCIKMDAIFQLPQICWLVSVQSHGFLLHNLVPENMFMTSLMLIFVNTGFRIQANSFKVKYHSWIINPNQWIFSRKDLRVFSFSECVLPKSILSQFNSKKNEKWWDWKTSFWVPMT